MEFLSLFVASDVGKSAVVVKTFHRRTGQQFVAFFEDRVAARPKGELVPTIPGRVSAQKAKIVREFPDRHPRVEFHFACTSFSWLNEIELWISERDPI